MSAAIGGVPRYAALSFASASEEPDPYPTETAAAFTARALSGLHARSAGVLPTLVPPIMAAVPAEQQQAMQAMLGAVMG